MATNKMNMTPCPYNCKKGAHPQGSKFCPVTGKPLPGGKMALDRKPGVSRKNKVVSKTGRTSAVKVPALDDIAGDGASVGKKILVLLVPLFLIAIAVTLYLLKDTSKPRAPMNRNRETTGTPVPNEPKKGPDIPTGKKTPIREPENPVIQSPVEAVVKRFDALDSHQAINYKNQLQDRNLHRLVFYKKKNINVGGQLALRLTIGERGDIRIKSVNDRGLVVKPTLEKNAILQVLNRDIRRSLGNSLLIPMQAENGSPLTVTDFPFTVIVIQTVKEINYARLSLQNKKNYENSINSLERFPIVKENGIKGKIQIFLNIDEKGKINIQKIYAKSLTVTSEKERKKLLTMVRGKIENHRIDPLLEANGTCLKVRNAPLSIITLPVTTTEFRDLPPEIITNYKKQMRNMGELTLDENIEIKGQIKLHLHIDEYGGIQIQNFDNGLLEVRPENKKNQVTKMIKKNIETHSLKSKKDERGAFLRVSDFPLTIKATTRNNKVILERIREF